MLNICRICFIYQLGDHSKDGKVLHKHSTDAPSTFPKEKKFFNLEAVKNIYLSIYLFIRFICCFSQ